MAGRNGWVLSKHLVCKRTERIAFTEASIDVSGKGDNFGTMSVQVYGCNHLAIGVINVKVAVKSYEDVPSLVRT